MTQYKATHVASLIDRARDELHIPDQQVQRASEDTRLSPVVRARLKVSTQNALRNIQVITERIGDERRGRIQSKVMGLINSPDPIWIRLRTLYTLIDELNSFNGENVACKRGCAHCCHLPVALLQDEAEMLGASIGRKPKRGVARNHDVGYYNQLGYGYDRPCPFLKDAECSIYKHRPMACRRTVNVDVDNLLCQLTEIRNVPVTYMDRTECDIAHVLICASRGRLPKTADIREYFPSTPSSP